jgi:glycosyltransferase involved in cell wall biosynthesis
MTVAPVSVVIPCYRCKETIDRAIASVAAQTLRPAEVILVDDGSGDGTREHLERLAAAHPAGWIRVVPLERNEGAASARNAGWVAARQPYLAFLDADDAWHPRKIELQYAYMAAHPDVALSGHGCRLARGPVEHERIEAIEAEPMSRLALLASNSLATPSVMLRRGLPQRFRAGRRHVDDHLLWLQIQGSGGQVVWLAPPLAYVYKARYGEGGLSAQLWPMEKAELANYWILRSEGGIGWLGAAALSAWSLAKFLRRLGLTLLGAQHGTS